MLRQDEESFHREYGGEWITEFNFSLSSEQLSKMYTKIFEYIENPGDYSLAGNHCTSVLIDCLLSAGIDLLGFAGKYGIQPINNGTMITPWELRQYLKASYNSSWVQSWSEYQIP